MKNTALQELNLNRFTLQTMSWFLRKGLVHVHNDYQVLTLGSRHCESVCVTCIRKLPCHLLNSNSPHDKIHHCNW